MGRVTRGIWSTHETGAVVRAVSFYLYGRISSTFRPFWGIFPEFSFIWLITQIITFVVALRKPADWAPCVEGNLIIRRQHYSKLCLKKETIRKENSRIRGSIVFLACTAQVNICRRLRRSWKPTPVIKCAISAHPIRFR